MNLHNDREAFHDLIVLTKKIQKLNWKSAQASDLIHLRYES